MESTPQSENNLNQNDIILTETQNPALILKIISIQ